MNLKYYAQRKNNDTNDKTLRKNGWRVVKVISQVEKGSKFLDVGCANGFLSEHVKRRQGKYFGIDYNEYFVNVCKNKGLNVKRCDVRSEKIPFENNYFDTIYCAHVLEHMDTYEQIQFFKEISRVLKKGGKLFLFSPTPYHWYFWDDETHVRPCTHGQLINLAKNFDLKIIESKYSLTRMFGNSLQRFLRLPPTRFFLWEVYLVAEK